MNSTDQRLVRAAGHLHHAAAQAERQAEDDLTSGLRTVAALARATAALISLAPETTDAELSIADSLDAALNALDEIDPGDGPPDLPLLAWHVHDLRRVAAECRP